MTGVSVTVMSKITATIAPAIIPAIGPCPSITVDGDVILSTGSQSKYVCFRICKLKVSDA